MADLREKVAYLEGLTKGMDLSADTATNKLLLKMIEVMGEMAETVDGLQNEHRELEDYVESIDEDLANVEENIYEEDDDGPGCVEMECPTCHEQVTFDADLLDTDEAVEVTCPKCGGVVYDNTLEVTAQDTASETALRTHPGI